MPDAIRAAQQRRGRTRVAVLPDGDTPATLEAQRASQPLCRWHGSPCAYPDSAFYPNVADYCPWCHASWAKIVTPAYREIVTPTWSKPKDGSAPQRIETIERRGLFGYGHTPTQHLAGHLSDTRRKTWSKEARAAQAGRDES